MDPNQKPSEGGTPPEGQQSQVDGEPLTLDKINALVQEKVNGAFAVHAKRLRESLGKDVKDLLGGALSPITEEMAALKAAREAAAAEPPKAGDQTAQSVEAAVAKARAKDDARIRELEAKAEAAERARAESEHTRLQQEERTTLAQALSESGIEGVRVKHALAYLYVDEKKIVRNEKGEVCFKMVRPYGDELVSLKDGLAEWLKTEDGKSFLPPRGVGGSGAQAGKAAGKGNNAQTKQEAGKAKLLAALGYRED